MATDDTIDRRIDTYFAEHLPGNWSRDRSLLDRFSRDMSMYRVAPRAVIFPQTEEDVMRAVAFARAESIPVTARGGGSSTGGCAVGSGLLLVISQRGRLAAPGEVRLQDGEAYISAGAGVRHSEVQTALERHGFFLPADPTSGSISCIGGNVATRASGPHALRHGAIDRYLRRVRFVTADGAVVDSSDPATVPAHLSAAISAARESIGASPTTRERIDRSTRIKCASGYNLSPLLRAARPESDLTGLMAGQIGTLGIITEVELVAERQPGGSADVLLGFDSLQTACAAVPFLLETDPAAIEIMNGEALRVSREGARKRTGAAAHQVEPLEATANYAAVLLVEYSGSDADAKVQSLCVTGSRAGMFPGFHPARTEEERASIWAARKGLLPAVANYGRNFRALSVVNDVGVPIEHLASFIGGAEACFRRYGLVAPIYGHAGNGNLHLRPLFDMRSENLESTIQAVADEIYWLAIRLGGTVSGEHGMGRLRAPYLEAEWGREVYDVMRALKGAFDPEDLLNTGCMFTDRPLSADLHLERILR